MVIDSDTNYLFVSARLANCKKFYSDFQQVLSGAGIQYGLLPKTKDIWAVDYMPIQTDENKFFQFQYMPDYLQNDKDIHTQTDPKPVCDAIKSNSSPVNLKVDGGNVIRGRKWVILTDKILKENRSLTKNKIIAELERIFEVQVILIPQEPCDKIGHADGMLRYYNDDTVLVNKYQTNDKPEFQNALRQTLKTAGLRTIEIPYYPYKNSNWDSAVGMYINFLQMNDFILLPTFSIHDDDNAVKMFSDLFPSYNIQTIDSRSIANDWGVLNCITWNILRTKNEC